MTAPGQRTTTPRSRRRGRIALDAEARVRALNALNFMRKGRSLRQATTDALTTPRTVQKYVGRLLAKGKAGRYAAKASDRLTRVVQFLTPEGQLAVKVRGSAAASRLARYWAAVKRYVTTGDASGLREFHGKTIRIQKVARRFITDLTVLDRLGHAGELPFENFYARTA